MGSRTLSLEQLQNYYRARSKQTLFKEKFPKLNDFIAYHEYLKELGQDEYKHKLRLYFLYITGEITQKELLDAGHVKPGYAFFNPKNKRFFTSGGTNIRWFPKKKI